MSLTLSAAQKSHYMMYTLNIKYYILPRLYRYWLDFIALASSCYYNILFWFHDPLIARWIFGKGICYAFLCSLTYGIDKMCFTYNYLVIRYSKHPSHLFVICSVSVSLQEYHTGYFYLWYIRTLSYMAYNFFYILKINYWLFLNFIILYPLSLRDKDKSF